SPGAPIYGACGALRFLGPCTWKASHRLPPFGESRARSLAVVKLAGDSVGGGVSRGLAGVALRVAAAELTFEVRLSSRVTGEDRRQASRVAAAGAAARGVQPSTSGAARLVPRRGVVLSA